jgi:hypothetical protein
MNIWLQYVLAAVTLIWFSGCCKPRMVRGIKIWIICCWRNIYIRGGLMIVAHRICRRICKIAKSDLTLSCLSACPHGTAQLPLTGFPWNLIFGNFFLKSVVRIQVSIKSDKNKGYLHEDQYTFLSYLTHFSLEWELLQTNVVEKIKAHVLYSVSPPANHAIYRIIWKNIVEQCRLQMTIWHMHIACWIPQASHTHRICNAYCFSTTTVVAWTCLSLTLYVHCPSRLLLSLSLSLLSLLTLTERGLLSVMSWP